MKLEQYFRPKKTNVTELPKLQLKISSKNLKLKTKRRKQWSDSDITYIHTRTGFEFSVNKLNQFLSTITDKKYEYR